MGRLTAAEREELVDSLKRTLQSIRDKADYAIKRRPGNFDEDEQPVVIEITAKLLINHYEDAIAALSEPDEIDAMARYADDLAKALRLVQQHRRLALKDSSHD